MFDRRTAWERELEAIGISSYGHRRRIPLEDIFRYTRGMTRLRAYDQVPGLSDASQTELHAAFARYLASRMAERGVHLDRIELAWVRTNIDTGRTRRDLIGTFPVGEGS